MAHKKNEEMLKSHEKEYGTEHANRMRDNLGKGHSFEASHDLASVGHNENDSQGNPNHKGNPGSHKGKY